MTSREIDEMTRGLDGRAVRGVYKMRNGEEAVVTVVRENQGGCAWGTRGYEPKDAVWSLYGVHRFKKYDLVKLEESAK